MFAWTAQPYRGTTFQVITLLLRCSVVSVSNRRTTVGERQFAQRWRLRARRKEAPGNSAGELLRPLRFRCGVLEQLVIQPLALQQLVVLASFDNLPLIDNQNLIGVADRAQTVRNDETRAPAH